MFAETRFEALADVFVHSVSTYGNAFQRVALADSPHEFKAGGIRKAQVAHEDVEGLSVDQLQSLGHIPRGFHLVARSLKETPEHEGRVAVIFHD